MSEWSVPGSGGQAIIGNTSLPEGTPRGVVLVAHGFKGYKDYGMFPFLARSFARQGLIAHRFNFSHSGMTDDIATFARPDLFALDTWNRQVDDLMALLGAIGNGSIAGRDLPRYLFGHSRGGVSVLLAAGRHHPELAGIVTASAPSACHHFSEAEAAAFRDCGYLVSPSSRTGQDLRIDRAWLDEQEADPAGHDLLALVSTVSTPVLVVHGAADPTVSAEAGKALVAAIGDNARLHLIEGADHVYGCPNPHSMDMEPSDALAELVDEAGRSLGV